MRKLLLIDAHAIIHRAFHALPPLYAKDGTMTNAVYGFFTMLHKTISDFQPTNLVICFDTPKPSFRKELFTDYQAKRPAMDDGLKPQIGLIKHLIDAAKIARCEKEGYEADDVIGTLTQQNKNNDTQIFILTGDKDIMQLVDKNVFVISPKTGLSSVTLYNPEEVEKKIGIPPTLIPDYKALAGDPSDNYGGAQGIGPKTALTLLHQYHNIENIYDHLDAIPIEKIRANLEHDKETVILFKKLATIVTDVDVHFSPEQSTYKGFDNHMRTELEQLELNTLIHRIFSSSRPVAERVPKQPKTEPQKPAPQLDLFDL